jgi:hypothetical protein
MLPARTRNRKARSDRMGAEWGKATSDRAAPGKRGSISCRPSHFNRPAFEKRACRSLHRCEYVEPKRRTITNRSQPSASCSLIRRYASRESLFSRFLRTAVLHPRTTPHPKRFHPKLFFWNRSRMSLLSILRAPLNSLLISELFRSLSRLVRLLLIGSGQLDTALRPPSLQDKPSSPGFHAGPKTEFPVPFYFAGLVGTLHRIVSLRGLWSYARKSKVHKNIQGIICHVNGPRPSYRMTV